MSQGHILLNYRNHLIIINKSKSLIEPYGIMTEQQSSMNLHSEELNPNPFGQQETADFQKN